MLQNYEKICIYQNIFVILHPIFSQVVLGPRQIAECEGY